MEICRKDTFDYVSRVFFAIPGGPAQSVDFEFDTLKFSLNKAISALGPLYPYCVEKNQISSYVSGDTCLIQECCGGTETRKFHWQRFKSLGMSDELYQDWRFNPPNYEKLKAWRQSMYMNQPKPFWRYEVLSFYGDTCKISYADRLPVSFLYDFSRLR
jgi:hypothetical protein